MGLSQELARIAAAAARFAEPGEQLTGVLAAEPSPGVRLYLCSFDGAGGRTWLALDGSERPVEARSLVREAASIAALCELAVDTAGGGELDELRARLVSLRLTENPEGIEEAEEAALALQHAIGAAPVLATPDYLDAVGTATRRLEQALGSNGASPFADAMKQGIAAVEALATEVERGYKRPLT